MSTARSAEDVLLHPAHWTAGLPEALRQVGVAELLNPCGLAFESYGTGRMMARSADEVRQTIGAVRPPHGETGGSVLLECLPPRARAGLEAAGLSLRDAGPSAVSASIDALKQARRIVHAVWPELSASVHYLVRCVHLLEARSPEFDCSYSRPDLPFSVFLSVPDHRARAGIERLAEALVHETMHLQLSLVERRIPLIEPARAGTAAFSPWRGGERPVRGVLHALYVFVVVQRLWRRACRRPPCGLDRQFARARAHAIRGEVREARHLAASPGLSRAGRQLVRNLLTLGGASAGDSTGLHSG